MLCIRTDMNEIIATGHIMRCIAIADAAKEKGEDTLFITADHQAEDMLEKKGYFCHVLNTKWNDMESELPKMKEVIKKRQIKKMLIDSYQVTPVYLRELSVVINTVYIDDINAFFYPVNALICCANCWEKFCYPNRYKKTRLYLGPKYVPLRKEFCNFGKKEIKPIAENLLLMSGGSDPYGILSHILKQLDINSYRNIDVICGMYHMQYDSLEKEYAMYENVHIHKAVTNMADYMQRADLAVSAGGTTLYELCALGTPAISYSLADNQLENVKKFQEDDIIDYAGDVRRDDVSYNIIQRIDACRDNEELRRQRSQKMQNLVDGQGAVRIAEILMN